MTTHTSPRKLYSFPGANGGHWELDEATLIRVKDRWIQIAALCDSAVKTSAPLREIVAPGLEMASEYYANKANQSGHAYLDTLTQMHDYAFSQAEACKKALGIYSESEAARTTVFTGLAGWEVEGL